MLLSYTPLKRQRPRHSSYLILKREAQQLPELLSLQLQWGWGLATSQKTLRRLRQHGLCDPQLRHGQVCTETVDCSLRAAPLLLTQRLCWLTRTGWDPMQQQCQATGRILPESTGSPGPASGRVSTGFLEGSEKDLFCPLRTQSF